MTPHDNLVLTCAWLQARPLLALGLSFPSAEWWDHATALPALCFQDSEGVLGVLAIAGGGGDEGRREEGKKRGEKAGGEEPFSSHPSLATAPSVARPPLLVHSPQAAGGNL